MDSKEFEIDKFMLVDNYLWNRTNQVHDTFYGENSDPENDNVLQIKKKIFDMIEPYIAIFYFSTIDFTTIFEGFWAETVSH